MSAFLDDSATATGGSGLIVDGVEANRATVSASAVQEVRINQDPYSAQYYWPGRGQMEIVTKSAADHYHGQFNFLFRDSAMNAQNALAPSKPYRAAARLRGPRHRPHLFRAQKQLPGLVQSRRRGSSTRSCTPRWPPRPKILPAPINANVPAPTRDTEFSTRAAHQFGDHHSAYAEYSYEDWTGQNQGVGGQTHGRRRLQQPLPRRRRQGSRRLDALRGPAQPGSPSSASTTSATTSNVTEAPRVSVAGNFTSGSAQNDALSTEYNFRLYDMMTWTHGRHFVKFGAGVPHINRRAFDDNTNALGSYTFGPTLAADGVTVLTTALENYEANHPSGYSRIPATCTSSTTSRRWARSSRTSTRSTAASPSRPAFATTGRISSPRSGWAFRPASPSPGFSMKPPRPCCAAAAASTTTASAPAPCSTSSATRAPSRAAAQSRSRSIPPRSPAPAACPSRLRRCGRVAGGARRVRSPSPACPTRFSTASPSSASLGEKATGRRQRLLHARHRRVPLRRHQRAHAAVRLHRAPRPGVRPHPPDAARRLLGRQRHGHLLPRPPQQVLHRLWPLHLVALRVQYRRHRLVPREPVRPQRRVVQRQLRSPPPPRHVRHVPSRRACSTSPPASSPTPAVPGASSPAPTPTATALFNARPDGAARNTETMPVLRRPRPALGPRLRHYPQQGRRSAAPGLFRRRIQHSEPRESPPASNQVVTSSGFGEVTSVNPPRRMQLGMRFEF